MQWGEKMKGYVIVVSGFSGAGKSSILIELVKSNKSFEIVRSYTTRKQRSERENYNFVSKEVFEEMIQNGEFLEWNVYNGCYYGTPKEAVLRILNERTAIPVLDIDVHGFWQVLEYSCYHSEFWVRCIFITAPAQELYYRLKTRGTENQESIVKRLEAALYECEEIPNYDAVIHNCNLYHAVIELKNFIITDIPRKNSFNVVKFKNDLEFILNRLKKKI